MGQFLCAHLVSDCKYDFTSLSCVTISSEPVIVQYETYKMRKLEASGAHTLRNGIQNEERSILNNYIYRLWIYNKNKGEEVDTTEKLFIEFLHGKTYQTQNIIIQSSLIDPH